MKFKDSVIQELKFYVYCLVDPRNNGVFYIGKGYGNRLFQHANDALSSEDETLKLNTIRDIISHGHSVKYYIIRHKLTEEAAYQLEAVLIDILTYKSFNLSSTLTNRQSGHHQWDEGIKSAEEINAIYDCQPLEIVGQDKLLVVKLNKTYNDKSPEKIYQRENMYEKARKYWKLNPTKANNADYVLAVYKGVVRAVYKPIRWYPEQNPELYKDTRYAFDGVEVSDSPYLNKDVSQYVNGTNPVRYINM